MAGEDHTVSGVAGRYATALFELGLEAKALEQIETDLNSFGEDEVQGWRAAILEQGIVFLSETKFMLLPAGVFPYSVIKSKILDKVHDSFLYYRTHFPCS